jgi:hypothetical protein
MFSSVATAGFMYSGNSKGDLLQREAYFSASTFFLHASVVIMGVAFSLGMEAVLGPVSPGIVGNILTMVGYYLAFTHSRHYLEKWKLMAKPIWIRKGSIWALWRRPVWILLVIVFMAFIPSLYLLEGHLLNTPRRK